MDKFIKYPLEIDKDKIDWNSGYMLKGGKQLIEILEKEISLDELIENRTNYDISKGQLKRLKSFLSNNCDIDKVREEMEFTSIISAISFFYNGAGLLYKLYKSMSLYPMVIDNKFESRFSFIEYDIVENDSGLIFVESKINVANWSSKDVTKSEEKMMNRLFFYKRNEDGDIEEIKDSKLIQEMIDMKKTMDLLT